MKNYGSDILAAYAISNHWALQAGYFARRETNDGNYLSITDSAVIHYQRKTWEASAGYFKNLPGRAHSYFQLFAGIGAGYFNFNDVGKDANGIIYQQYHYAKALKFYLQPAVFLNAPNHFTTAISSRFTLIKFKKIKTNYSFTQLNNFKLDSIALSPTLFWEPALTNYIGFKKITGLKIALQAGFAFLVSKKFVDTRPFNFSAGINLDLPKILTRKKRADKN